MRVLVTGGNGFIGRAIVEQLLARGDEVRVVGRSRYPELEALGVACFQADLASGASLADALRGCDVVFHVAAKAGVWGTLRDFYQNNVTATQHIVRHAARAGVGRMVYTSSPSVVFGEESVEHADESRPYPRRYLAAYPYTKALAEQWLLRQPGLLTVAIRPPLVWGPRDATLMPILVRRARAGRLRRVGDGTNLVDVTYVENAAAAHLAAADRLREGSPVVGRAYFIGQEQPVNLWAFINRLLELVGVPQVPARPDIPYPVARAAAALMEDTYRLLGGGKEPPLTRLLVAQMANSRYFDLSAARRDLGYTPHVSTEEGLARTAAWLRAAG